MIFDNIWQSFFFSPRPGGSVLSVSDSWPGGCEFETRLKGNFSPAYFHLSPLLKHVRKVVGGFGKKFVLVLVWGGQETHGRHRPPWYDLTCWSGVKPQYNQPTNFFFSFRKDLWIFRGYILGRNTLESQPSTGETHAGKIWIMWAPAMILLKYCWKRRETRFNQSIISLREKLLSQLCCRARLRWARHTFYNDSSVYVRASEFVRTITSTNVDGFQNNLTQLFSITCRCAIWNICSGRSKVKVTLEGQIFVRTITPTILNRFQFKFAQLFSIKSRRAIWNICSGRP